MTTREDEDLSLEQMIQNADTLSRDTIERAAQQAGEPGVISENMNMHYAMLNDSIGQYDDEPKFLVYDHSPGFESGQSGYVQVKGRIPSQERPDVIPGQSNAYRKDTDVETDFIKLEVLPEEGMPRKARYEGADVPEAVLQHEEVDMETGENVTMQIHPWGEGQITGTDWQDNLQNYERGDLQHRST